MTSSDDEGPARAAVVRFYDALDQLLTGKGTEAMAEAWHHSDRVTSGHPLGDWAHGWDQVWATWGEFAAIGRDENAGSHIKNLKVFVYGDIAYSTCVFVSPPAFGSVQMNVTNVVHKQDGEWKVIHHHPDRTPSVGAAMEKILAED